jgi:hypothetical protein
MTNSTYTPELPNEPIGMLPDGTLNIVKIDDPPFTPLIVDDLGRALLRPGSKK